MPPLIRVVGSLNVDMVSVTPRFPEPGETLLATSFNTSPGGKGANQAVACARLSRPRPGKAHSSVDASVVVELVGAVGGRDIFFSTLLKPTLIHSGVDISNIREIVAEHTGTAVIIVDSSASGENRILYTPGANFSGMQPSPEVLGVVLSEPLPDVLVLQGEIPIETLISILRRIAERRREQHEIASTALEHDIEVVFNPAPAPEGGLPMDTYAAVDHLIMNETECELMVPRQLRESMNEPRNSKARREKIARYFHSVGVAFVLVTLGEEGVWYSAGVPGKEAQAEQSSWMRVIDEIPATKVGKVVDTTGAGDTFVGCYAVEVARRHERRRANSSTARIYTADEHQAFYESETQKAVQRSVRASALCIQKQGAMDSIPWEDDM